MQGQESRGSAVHGRQAGDHVRRLRLCPEADHSRSCRSLNRTGCRLKAMVVHRTARAPRIRPGTCWKARAPDGAGIRCRSQRERKGGPAIEFREVVKGRHVDRAVVGKDPIFRRPPASALIDFGSKASRDAGRALFVVGGKLWRMSDPDLDPERRVALVHDLMDARR